jgi:hypothetical protein
MTPLRADVLERLQAHEQRLLELRDMTQDREELREIRIQLASLQTILSDAREMDDTQLHELLAKYGKAPK